MSSSKRPRVNVQTGLSNDLGSSGSLSLSSTDVLLPIIQQYALQRRYDSAWKNQKLQTPLDVAIRGVLETRSSPSNAYIFSPHIIDPNSIEQQFSRLKVWMYESSEATRLELLQLLFPVFSHFYLEMVAAGHKIPASKFFKKYQSLFIGSSEFSSLLRLIPNVLTPDDLINDASVFSYYSKKYRVVLSEPTHSYLMRLLQQEARQVPLLIYILNSKLELRINTQKHIASSEVTSLMGQNLTQKDEFSTELSAPGMKTANVIKGRLRELQESAKSLPSILLYSVSNQAASLTSSTIFLDASLMAVGDDNSTIHLWSLIQPCSHEDSLSKPCGNDASSVGLDARKIALDVNPNKPKEVSHNKVLLGHSGPVYGVCFTPRIQVLLSCSADTTMRAWDTATGVNRALYRGHVYPIWTLDVDNMGLNIATGSMDHTARLWNLEYNFPIRLYCDHEDDVEVVKFHPNGELLATGSGDQMIKIWQHVDAKPACALTGHKGSINALAFSLDGRLLASGGVDRKVRIWDLRTLKILDEFKGHTAMVDKLAWNADSSILASGGRDGTVRLWSVEQKKRGLLNGLSANSTAGQSESLAFYSTNCSSVLDLCYSPHNNLIVTGDGEKIVDPIVKLEPVVNGQES